MEKQFLQLIHDHQEIIYKISALYRDSKEDREDLFQEIVYQLWKSYPGFRGASKVSTWMYRIALNTALAIYRKPRLKIDHYPELPPKLHSLREESISENEDRLFEALGKLSDAEKAIVALYLDEFSYKEMAAITGFSETNIGVRLNRIKNKLKEIIK
ncbi:sigma-70 family RNA polymerase sigma factor [Niabella yanshanensis]|uniref:Sigma-70 family RNA polymerase sigma factor n=1 Tax=Niabella yanshanensis TaxID=577386 RepID=A0ABZ0W0C0_9BACT|nr:sigma-70 family RNA polymerase sigma factor [Niabella yanshanensis]WQD36621.1 sigma-70 family RNA polymerase sigma factor [Niabella yanshanensis]